MKTNACQFQKPVILVGASEAFLNHGHDAGVSFTGRYRHRREPTCRQKIYLAEGVDQLFHNINMPFLDCNEKGVDPSLS